MLRRAPHPQAGYNWAVSSELGKGATAPPNPLIPAATVVIVRDSVEPERRGIEVLMLRRNSKLDFAGGMWVFPGGRVDQDDWVGLEPDDHEGAARAAAVREAQEEAGVVLGAGDLVWFSHWTPPVISPKRFGTYFFVTRAPEGDLEITIDGGEIHDHDWFRPADAMALRNALEIELAPPTWITLETLARFDSAASTIEGLGSGDPELFCTQITKVDGNLIACFRGDELYEVGDAPEGARHRLWISNEAWSYERDGWPGRAQR